MSSEILNMLFSGVVKSKVLDEISDCFSPKTIASDVYETKEQFIIVADVPGMIKANVKVNVNSDNMLTISYKRVNPYVLPHNTNTNTMTNAVLIHPLPIPQFHSSDIRYGKYFKSIPLPASVNIKDIISLIENGTVTLKFGKKSNAASGSIEITL